MRRIASLLLALFAVGAPAQAGLLEILERTTQPKVPLRLQPKLPPMPLTRSRGKNWVGTTHPKADLPLEASKLETFLTRPRRILPYSSPILPQKQEQIHHRMYWMFRLRL